jgi:hypothetical protein
MRHQLGLTCMPASAPGVRCQCGESLRHNLPDHAMVCNKTNGSNTMRHQSIAKAVRRVICHAGLPSTLECAIRPFQGHAPAPQQDQPQTRGDILTITDDGPEIYDISVAHPLQTADLNAAAQRDGVSGSKRRQSKLSHYRRRGDLGFAVRAFVVESYGRLDEQAVQALRALARLAGGNGRLAKSAFLRGAYQEISMALCRANAEMYRKCNQNLARASGHRYQEGLRVPRLLA